MKNNKIVICSKCGVEFEDPVWTISCTSKDNTYHICSGCINGIICYIKFGAVVVGKDQISTILKALGIRER